MFIPQLESKDITFFLAVKPYMSLRAQQLLDLILLLVGPSPRSQGALLDPVPVLTLLHLARNLSPPPEPELPPVVEMVDTGESSEEDTDWGKNGDGGDGQQGGEENETDTP